MAYKIKFKNENSRVNEIDNLTLSEASGYASAVSEVGDTTAHVLNENEVVIGTYEDGRMTNLESIPDWAKAPGITWKRVFETEDAGPARKIEAALEERNIDVAKVETMTLCILSVVEGNVVYAKAFIDGYCERDSECRTAADLVIVEPDIPDVDDVQVPCPCGSGRDLAPDESACGHCDEQ